MNYGEEITYWYLRLNGFFPLTNFVVHQVEDIAHSSEIDILAVRPKYVYEQIGGVPDDWDETLVGVVGFDRTLGVVCEVKTGRFDLTKLFKPSHLRYGLGRLGIVPQNEIHEITERLQETSLVNTNQGDAIFKLLITEKQLDSQSFISKTLVFLEDFIENCIRKYPDYKYADRMFFCSGLFQHTIHRIDQERKTRAHSGV